MAETTKLVGYCGLHCGACGIYQGRIAQQVDALHSTIQAYGFDKMKDQLATWEPAFKHYPEFDQVMTALAKMFGSCPGCPAGGGDPNCAIRKCAQAKNYIACSDCTQMTSCDTLKRYPNAPTRLKGIRQQGLKAWQKDMEKRVKAGYCYLDDKKP